MRCLRFPCAFVRLDRTFFLATRFEPPMENRILQDRHVLVCVDAQLRWLSPHLARKKEELVQEFCGRVVRALDVSPPPIIEGGVVVFVTGDALANIALLRSSHAARSVELVLVRELVAGDDVPGEALGVVSLGQVPRSVHAGAGVLFPRLFDRQRELFAAVSSSHAFQSVSESRKEGAARRTGVYLCETALRASGAIDFHLMRSSTTFDGPTEGFAPADRAIVHAVARAAAPLFALPFTLNHVQAQVYHNRRTEAGKERKAAIKAHTDKTQDMASSSVIAFVSFYDADDSLDVSSDALATLLFRRKGAQPDDDDTGFRVALPPGSAFLIPLGTNRQYTHEIRPPGLPVEKIPTRLGFVIRCSATRARFERDASAYAAADAAPNGRTKIFLDPASDGILLEEPTDENVEALKALYFAENSTAERVDYGGLRHCSLNPGDFLPPRFSSSTNTLNTVDATRKLMDK